MSLFDNYTIRGKLKFYKINTDSKLTICFNIGSDHKIDDTIENKITDFLNKIFLEEYETEEAHLEKEEWSKARIKAEKEHQKLVKQQQKKKKVVKKDPAKKYL